MAQKQIAANTKIVGLETNPSILSVTPGSLQIAQNITLNREGMAEGRRGFAYHTSHSAPVNSLFEYKSNLFTQCSDGSLTRNDTIDQTTVSIPGTWQGALGSNLTGVDARGTLFLNASKGISKLASLQDSPKRAGVAPGLDCQAAITGTGLGFLKGGYQCGYRIVFMTKTNEQEVRGAPTPQYVVANLSKVQITTLTSASSVATATTASAHGLTTSDKVLIAGVTQAEYNGQKTITVTGTTTFTYAVTGTPTTPATTTGTMTVQKDCNAVVSFSVPQGLDASDKYEVYRTLQTPNTIRPGDDHYLIKTGVVGTSSLITFTDDILEDFAITPLYTNDDIDGALNANWIVPISGNVEVYKDYLFAGNLQTEQSLNVTLLSTSGGLVAGTSSLTISDTNTSRTYVFSTAEDFANNKFQLFTTGTPSQSIEATARSLVRAINQDALGKWWAQYVSGETDDPGKIYIFTRDISSPAFHLTCDSATTSDNFDPDVPVSGSTLVSANDVAPNRLQWSKVQQPEHFPILNYLDIGRKDKAIQKVVALRDSIFVIKEDGIFYLSGNNPTSSSLRTLDTTTICIAPNSVVRLNNDIYMLSNQGFVRFNENGVNVISFPIENTVREFQAFDNVQQITHAVGFERDRIYVCWVPESNTDTYANTAYVYNIFREQWSVWKKPSTASALVNGKLFIGSGWENKTLVQRDTRTSGDLSDEELDIEIIDVLGAEMTLNYTFPYVSLKAGFSIHQGNRVAKVRSIVSRTGSQYVVELDGTADVFDLGPATARIPIDIHLRHHPSTAGNPGVTKTYLDFSFVLDRNTVSQVTLEVAGNESGMLTEIPVLRTPLGAYGTNYWGSGFWGDADTLRSVPIRENVPNAHVTSEWLTIGIQHSVSGERFACLYSNITYAISTDVTSVN